MDGIGSGRDGRVRYLWILAVIGALGLASPVAGQTAAGADAAQEAGREDAPGSPQATLVVTTQADETTTNGQCSLREALANGNNNNGAHPDCASGSGADTITFASNVAMVTLSPANGMFLILDGTSIDGRRAGFADVVVSGAGSKSVFGISNSGQTLLQHLTIVEGHAASSDGGVGGGILSETALTLRFVTLTGNHADNGGAGIMAAGPLTLDRVTVSGNSGPSGAGILVINTTATIIHSTIAGNTAASGAGGIHVFATAATTAVSLQASIVANNGVDCALQQFGSQVASVAADHSLVEAPGACVIAAGAGNLSGVDPWLGPLQDNGGGQWTALPTWGSAVFDAAGACADVDQRGVARPQGAACDIGAVEIVPPTYHTLTVDVVPGVVGGSGGVVVSGSPPNYVLRCGDASNLCSADFIEGTSVTLRGAIPSYGGWRFVQWSGDCSGTSSTVSVTMNADRHCIGVYAPYTVSGGVDGLVGSGLVLHLSVFVHGEDIAVPAGAGAFTFNLPVQHGDHYAVGVAAQPTGPSQTCTVSNGSGTGTGYQDITNVGVHCTTNTYTIAGGVSNLAGSGLVLRLNGGNDLAIAQNGYFVFPGALEDGSAYDVTVATQPAGGQVCTVTGGSGALAGVNVTDVLVACGTPAHAVGGTVSGLAGSGLVLRLNGDTDLAIEQDGSFAFAPLADGSTYSVAVAAQPGGQHCSVSNGSGTIDGADVTDIEVGCANGTGAMLEAVLDDGVEYAKAGQTLVYHLVITNSGDAATDPDTWLAYQANSALDPDAFEWSCSASGGAVCDTSETGVFMPPGSTLTYDVTATVLAATLEDTATLEIYSVPQQDPQQAVLLASDVNVLVIHRDGFEQP